MTFLWYFVGWNLVVKVGWISGYYCRLEKLILNLVCQIRGLLNGIKNYIQWNDINTDYFAFM